MFVAIWMAIFCVIITIVIAGVGLFGYGLYLFCEKGMISIRSKRERHLQKEFRNQPLKSRIERALYDRYASAKAALSQIDDLDALEIIGQTAKDERIRENAKAKACARFGHEWETERCRCRRCGQNHDYTLVESNASGTCRKYSCCHCGDTYEEKLVSCPNCFGEGEILCFASESGMGGGISQTCTVCGGTGVTWSIQTPRL